MGSFVAAWMRQILTGLYAIPSRAMGVQYHSLRGDFNRMEVYMILRMYWNCRYHGSTSKMTLYILIFRVFVDT